MASLRSVIETLKWLDYPDVLSSALVCQLFRRAVSASELWHDLCERYSIPYSESPFLAFQSSLFRSIYTFLLSPQSQFAYDCRKLRWQKLPAASLHCDWTSAYAVIGRNVMVTGGNAPRKKEAWLLHTDSGHTSQLESLNEVRAGHGLVHLDGVVYAFGGAYLPKTSEKYLNSHWFSLKDMNFAHSWCSPSTFQREIYICGGETAHCEVFSPATDSFSILDFVLPQATEACVCVVSQKVAVVTRNFVTEIDKKRIARVVKHEEWGSSWTNMSPAGVGLVAFLPRERGNCVRLFSLADYSSFCATKPS